MEKLKRVTKNLYLDQKIVDAVNVVATAEKRSWSNMVGVLIEIGLNNLHLKKGEL